MANSSKIDNIVNNIFSNIEINKKENYYQWKKDKDNFQNELEISLNAYDNNTKQLILLRLEKDSEAGNIDFYNSNGTIDFSKVTKITQNIAKEIENKNISANEIQNKENTIINNKDNNIEKENIESITKEFEDYMAGWSIEEKEEFAKNLNEARKKREEVKRLMQEDDLSQEEAEKKAGVTEKDKDYLEIDDLRAKNKTIQGDIDFLKNKEANGIISKEEQDRLEELNKQKEEIENEINKKMDTVRKKDQEVKRLMQEEGLTQEEAEKKVSWRANDSSIKEYIEESKNVNEYNKGREWGNAEKKSNIKNSDIEIDVLNINEIENLYQLIDKGVEPSDISNAIESFTGMLTMVENLEDLEEILQQMSDDEKDTISYKIIEAMTKDKENLEKINDEEYKDELVNKLLDVSEQISKCKITDKEAEKPLEERKELMDISAIEAQKQQEVQEQSSSSLLENTHMDTEYIVNGVPMNIDEQWLQFFQDAQERGEDLEEAYENYKKEQEVEEIEAKTVQEEKKEDKAQEEQEQDTVIIEEDGTVRESAEEETELSAETLEVDENEFFDLTDVDTLKKSKKSKKVAVVEKDENGNLTNVQIFKPVEFFRQSDVTTHEFQEAVSELTSLTVDKGKSDIEKDGTEEELGQE